MSTTTTTVAPLALTTLPGLTRAVAAVRAAETGLLRAVALDVVATGEGTALDALGPEAVAVLRAVTGPTSVDLQAHTTADGGATSLLGRAGHGVAVSTHLSLVPGGAGALLAARVRIVGTHGSVLVDLLRPRLDVVTAEGTEHVPFSTPGATGMPAPVEGRAATPGDETAQTLSAIAESARSGRTTTTTW